MKPYIIIPKLINQPTWGGSYIIDLKGLSNAPFAKHVKIGQSYELFSGTKLFTAGNSVNSPSFAAETGYPDHDGTDAQYFPLTSPEGYRTLSDLIAEDPAGTLGAYVWEKYHMMPLLIKINHARGNSFQLHICPDKPLSTWKPKAESWYYMEDGLLTYGIKRGASTKDYKDCCVSINQFMGSVSRDIQRKQITLEEGTEKAKSYIAAQNPWQFVNTIEAKKYDLIDLSGGGLHHSWEEDMKRYPVGNVIYEVQQDIMDPVSTVRSFDQGKIKSDGSIRTIAIDDYFQSLDTDESRNDIGNARRTMNGTNALMTPHYAMDIISVTQSFTDAIDASFVHLYVRDGEVKVSAGDGDVVVTRGSSCFVPAAAVSYTIDAVKPESVILKTYIPKSQ